jgi:hypothetical protein
MIPCQICGRPGKNRRVRVDDLDGTCRHENRVICSECDIAVRKKPSPSKRGRKRDRHVPAPSTDTWIAALRRSWSISNDCFRCELSGLRLDLGSAYKPLSLSCDHDPPGSANFLVVAWLINDMKNDHGRDEFYANVMKLAAMVSGGGPNPVLADKFQDSFANLRHWRRACPPKSESSAAVQSQPQRPTPRLNKGLTIHAEA